MNKHENLFCVGQLKTLSHIFLMYSELSFIFIAFIVCIFCPSLITKTIFKEMN